MAVESPHSIIPVSRRRRGIARCSGTTAVAKRTAGHQSRHAALTPRGAILFLEAEFENLPTILTLEAESGGLISLSNSGVISPGNVPPPIWPVKQVCHL